MGWESVVVKALVGGFAGSMISNMLSGGNEPAPQAAVPTPEAPKVEPVTPMPTPNDAAVKDAKRKSIAAMTARQGRASTILTGNEDSTGGGGSTLGG